MFATDIFTFHFFKLISWHSFHANYEWPQYSSSNQTNHKEVSAAATCLWRISPGANQQSQAVEQALGLLSEQLNTKKHEHIHNNKTNKKIP